MTKNYDNDASLQGIATQRAVLALMRKNKEVQEKPATPTLMITVTGSEPTQAYPHDIDFQPEDGELTTAYKEQTPPLTPDYVSTYAQMKKKGD